MARPKKPKYEYVEKLNLFRKRVKDIHKQLDERASYLRMKDRYIAILAALLGVAVTAIIVLLV